MNHSEGLLMPFERHSPMGIGHSPILKRAGGIRLKYPPENPFISQKEVTLIDDLYR
jgi:hypothetical protein